VVSAEDSPPKGTGDEGNRRGTQSALRVRRGLTAERHWRRFPPSAPARAASRVRRGLTAERHWRHLGSRARHEKPEVGPQRTHRRKALATIHCAIVIPHKPNVRRGLTAERHWRPCFLVCLLTKVVVSAEDSPPKGTGDGCFHPPTSGGPRTCPQRTHRRKALATSR